MHIALESFRERSEPICLHETNSMRMIDQRPDFHLDIEMPERDMRRISMNIVGNAMLKRQRQAVMRTIANLLE